MCFFFSNYHSKNLIFSFPSTPNRSQQDFQIIMHHVESLFESRNKDGDLPTVKTENTSSKRNFLPFAIFALR